MEKKQEREYVWLPKSPKLPNSSKRKKKLNDEFWISLIHFHLLRFYSEYNLIELRQRIDAELKKTERKEIESLIKDFIWRWFDGDRSICLQGIITNLESKAMYGVNAFYDIKFQHSDWIDLDTGKLKYYSVECKNLNSLTASINEYVYNSSKKDGGVYRYFNGKYSQNTDFGGMLGFILDGNIEEVKQNIISKLAAPFDISPEGDLIENGIKLNSIENNTFTFDSVHNRHNNVFVLNHILFKV